jgi:signal transduction histidine kinase
MDQTIHEILALASVRRAAEVPLGAIDTGGIITEVREDLSRMLADSGATLLLPDAWPSVRGYRPWVREVWLNYLSNAIKYGGRPDHGIPPHISIGWEKADAHEAADAIRFWVEDNGTGLTPEQQEKLFVEFTRLERDRVEGHGLGLSIVLRIVSRLGGTAGVTSVPGRGSRFWFTLRAENN